MARPGRAGHGFPRGTGCGARALLSVAELSGKAPLLMPGQTARQQTADMQRQRSTCRRATSGTLMSWRRRTAVFMSRTLTLAL
ncbi:hypothetical protein HY68_07580 [Streptomyces sp. AcH 505]|nr:hypothetical protein HY68_07580 [Streptomyces sp. AcH 505]